MLFSFSEKWRPRTEPWGTEQTNNILGDYYQPLASCTDLFFFLFLTSQPDLTCEIPQINLPFLEVFVYVCWGLVWFELRVFGLLLNITGYITWSSWNCGGNIMWYFVDESGFQVTHSITMISCYFWISFEDTQGKTYSFLVSSYIEFFYAPFYICW